MRPTDLLSAIKWTRTHIYQNKVLDPRNVLECGSSQNGQGMVESINPPVKVKHISMHAIATCPVGPTKTVGLQLD